MLVMRTTKYPAYSVCKLISSKQTVRLYHLALAMYPFGFYGVKPRALFRQQAAYDPHSTAAVLDFSVVFSEPAPDLFRDVPASVVPDQEQHRPAHSFKLLATPLEELSC
jgi:hypothetical protein